MVWLMEGEHFRDDS